MTSFKEKGMGLPDKNIAEKIEFLYSKIVDSDIKLREFDVTQYKREYINIEKPTDLAPFIEHTSLKPGTTKENIKNLCKEAIDHGFYGVCVNPNFVEEAAKHLEGSNQSVTAVVGFPLGANLTATKVEETRQVIEKGANEIDMVMSIGALIDNDFKTVYEDIKSVVEVSDNKYVKVIIETGLLDESQKIISCLLALGAGASFVKTSTGFLYLKADKCFENKGATLDDIRLMKSVVGDRMGIKAAGGITEFSFAKKLVEAGATRLGCSSSVSIIEEAH